MNIHPCYWSTSSIHRETVTNLDESKLPMDKRGKLEKDAQIMIKMLPRQIELEKKISMKIKAANAGAVQSRCEKLNRNVIFDYNDYEGRYALARDDIKVGDEVLWEKPHCTALLQQYALSHCQNCFTRYVVRSHTQCQHQFESQSLIECDLFDFFWQNDCSVAMSNLCGCHLLLREMSQ